MRKCEKCGTVMRADLRLKVNGGGYGIVVDVDEKQKTTTIDATWEGTSWMWYPGNDVTLKDTSSYPQTTLGGTKVPSTNEFSIVLSYDTTRFDW